MPPHADYTFTLYTHVSWWMRKWAQIPPRAAVTARTVDMVRPTTLDGSLGCKKAEIFGDIEEIYVDIAAIKGDIQRIFRQTKSP